MLVFAGAADGIAPVGSVKASVPLLTGSREVRFEIVPGGHLGMLTGRKARTSTWVVLDEWIDQWSQTEAPARAGARTRRSGSDVRRRPQGGPGREEGAREEGVGQEGRQEDGGLKKTEGDHEDGDATKDRATAGVEIGTNPTRRYGSAGSRALGR